MPNSSRPLPSDVLLKQYLSADRLSTYLQERQQDVGAVLDLYLWNTAVAGAFWETLGHFEIIVRNVLDARLTIRHHRHHRPRTWLHDPAEELTFRARDDIDMARRRVRQKGKALRHGQILAELSFGFWRFLLIRTYRSTLWPDVAAGFPYAPNRNLRTVEDPVSRLYEFRNRIAHHERLWSEHLHGRYDDVLTVLGYVDPALRNWVENTSRVPTVLAQRPSP